MARSSQRKSLSDGCGPASLCRKGTSKFRSLRCATRSARSAISSVRNSDAATGSLAYFARTPQHGPADPAGERSRGFVEVWSGKTADNRPVWFQFALVAETSINGDVVPANTVRNHGLTVEHSRPKIPIGASYDVDPLRRNLCATQANSGDYDSRRSPSSPTARFSSDVPNCKRERLPYEHSTRRDACTRLSETIGEENV